MATMQRRFNFSGRIEAAALLAMGAWCVTLLGSGDYWLFLHPRFQWLLAASSFLCTFLGMLLMVYPLRQAHWRGVAGLLLTIALGVVGQHGMVDKPSGQADTLDPQATAGLEAGGVPEFFSYDNEQYLPLNLAELYLQAESDAPPLPDEHFAMRGKWLADPLDLAPGVLLRMQFTCCLADSVGVGFRITGDAVDDAAPKPGQWVRVLGHLEPAPPAMAAKAQKVTPQFEGIFMSVVNSGYVFVAHQVVPVEMPDVPFMFDIRMDPPFAY